jgi:hypothetical protein
LPPAALNGLAYAVPAVAGGKDLVAMLSGPGDEEPAVIVTEAVPDLAVSSTLVAVMVAFVEAVTDGA